MDESGKKTPLPSCNINPKTTPTFFTIKQIFQTSFRILKLNFFPLFGILLLLTLFSTILSLLVFPNSLWQAGLFIEANSDWLTKIEADSTFILSPEQQVLYNSYSMSSLSLRILQWAFGFLIPSALLLLSSSKLYHDIDNDPDVPATWIQSIRRGFSTPKRAASSILLILILMWGIPIGIMLFFLPGILVMCFFFYCVFAITIDEKEGKEVFRGGRFYLRDNGWKTLFFLLIGFFLPWGLSLLYYEPLINLLFPNGILSEWLDPATRNYGMLFLYFICEYFFQYVLYFWFPVFYSVVFFDIQSRKIVEQQTRKAALSVQTDVKIKTIEVSGNQRDYACLVCGARMPLGQKKCSQCGEIFRIVIKRK